MTTVEQSPRLDVRLAADRGISRTAARAMIDAGLVLVNGAVARSARRVGDADTVDVLEPEPAPPQAIAPGPPVQLRILHEDAWLAVVDKPAGLVVHPAPGHPAGTLADGLRQRGDAWSVAGGAERPGIVHRLDRYTSGLLVVARNEAAHRALSAQLAARTMGRHYWVLVWGGVSEDTAEVDMPIARDPRDRKCMAVVEGGRPAQTDLRVLERLPEATVVEARLRTGRTHQVRVHLQAIGRPVVGDPLYGRRDDPHAGRPALHAAELHLVHPADGEPRSWTSPLPADLQHLLELARAGRLRR